MKDSRLELSEEEIRNNLNHNLKETVKRFIQRSKSLDHKSKNLLIDELGSNWADGLFDVNPFIRDTASMVADNFTENKMDMQLLWNDVVVQAAKHSDKPEDIADNVVKRNNEQFTTSYSECKWVLK